MRLIIVRDEDNISCTFSLMASHTITPCKIWSLKFQAQLTTYRGLDRLNSKFSGWNKLLCFRDVHVEIYPHQNLDTSMRYARECGLQLLRMCYRDSV